MERAEERRKEEHREVAAKLEAAQERVTELEQLHVQAAATVEGSKSALSNVTERWEAMKDGQKSVLQELRKAQSDLPPLPMAFTHPRLPDPDSVDPQAVTRAVRGLLDHVKVILELKLNEPPPNREPVPSPSRPTVKIGREIGVDTRGLTPITVARTTQTAPLMPSVDTAALEASQAALSAAMTETQELRAELSRRADAAVKAQADQVAAEGDMNAARAAAAAAVKDLGTVRSEAAHAADVAAAALNKALEDASNAGKDAAVARAEAAAAEIRATAAEDTLMGVVAQDPDSGPMYNADSLTALTRVAALEATLTAAAEQNRELATNLAATDAAAEMAAARAEEASLRASTAEAAAQSAAADASAAESARRRAETAEVQAIERADEARAAASRAASSAASVAKLGHELASCLECRRKVEEAQALAEVANQASSAAVVSIPAPSSIALQQRLAVSWETLDSLRDALRRASSFAGLCEARAALAEHRLAVAPLQLPGIENLEGAGVGGLKIDELNDRIVSEVSQAAMAWLSGQLEKSVEDQDFDDVKVSLAQAVAQVASASGLAARADHARVQAVNDAARARGVAIGLAEAYGNARAAAYTCWFTPVPEHVEPSRNDPVPTSVLREELSRVSSALRVAQGEAASLSRGMAALVGDATSARGLRKALIEEPTSPHGASAERDALREEVARLSAELGTALGELQDVKEEAEAALARADAAETLARSRPRQPSPRQQLPPTPPVQQYHPSSVPSVPSAVEQASVVSDNRPAPPTPSSKRTAAMLKEALAARDNALKKAKSSTARAIAAERASKEALTSVAAAREQVAELVSRVQASNGRAAEAQRQAEAAVSAANARVKEAEERALAVAGTGDVQATKLAEAEATAQRRGEALVTLRKAKAVADGKVEALTEKLSGLESRLATVNRSVGSKERAVAALKSRMSALDQLSKSQEVEINRLKREAEEAKAAAAAAVPPPPPGPKSPSRRRESSPKSPAVSPLIAEELRIARVELRAKETALREARSRVNEYKAEAEEARKVASDASAAAARAKARAGSSIAAAERKSEIATKEARSRAESETKEKVAAAEVAAKEARARATAARSLALRLTSSVLDSVRGTVSMVEAATAMMPQEFLASKGRGVDDGSELDATSDVENLLAALSGSEPDGDIGLPTMADADAVVGLVESAFAPGARRGTDKEALDRLRRYVDAVLSRVAAVLAAVPRLARRVTDSEVQREGDVGAAKEVAREVTAALEARMSAYEASLAALEDSVMNAAAFQLSGVDERSESSAQGQMSRESSPRGGHLVRASTPPPMSPSSQKESGIASFSRSGSHVSWADSQPAMLSRSSSRTSRASRADGNDSRAQSIAKLVDALVDSDDDEEDDVN